MNLINIINFSSLDDQRGSLVALEENQEIPFKIKRIYYIFDSQKGISRGFHAHRDIKQVIICLSGSCNILLDNGFRRERVQLDNPKKGILVEKLIWREIHDFSSNCILLVLASDFFKEDDYIRDYTEFIKIVNENV